MTTSGFFRAQPVVVCLLLTGQHLKEHSAYLYIPKSGAIDPQLPFNQASRAVNVDMHEPLARRTKHSSDIVLQLKEHPYPCIAGC